MNPPPLGIPPNRGLLEAVKLFSLTDLSLSLSPCAEPEAFKNGLLVILAAPPYKNGLGFDELWLRNGLSLGASTLDASSVFYSGFGCNISIGFGFSSFIVNTLRSLFPEGGGTGVFGANRLGVFVSSLELENKLLLVSSFSGKAGFLGFPKSVDCLAGAPMNPMVDGAFASFSFLEELGGLISSFLSGFPKSPAGGLGLDAIPTNIDSLPTCFGGSFDGFPNKPPSLFFSTGGITLSFGYFNSILSNLLSYTSFLSFELTNLEAVLIESSSTFYGVFGFEICASLL